MLKKIVNRLLRHRHFWRDVSFDELSEIYVAMLFRSLAMSLIGVFVPIFLLKSGYGLSDIAIFYIFFFIARVTMDVAAGYTVAKVGPKRTMLVAEIFHIAAAGLFVTLPSTDLHVGLPALIWGAGNSLFYIAFHVSFSKLKHSNHGGKELSYVQIMEKVGGTIGPMTGGILATLFGPQYIFLIAIVLMLLGLVPLFRTAEPVKTNQKLDFKNFDILAIKKDLVSISGFHVEHNLNVVLWPIFLTLFIFTDNIYATIGSLASLGIMVSITASYVIGRLVDDRRGGLLLKASAITNSGLYAVKPFVSGIGGILSVNILNEILAVGFRLPFFKGLYDAADDKPGYRIVYIVIMEAVSSFAKLICWILLLMLSWALTPYQLIMIGFFVAAIASLVMTSHNFKALHNGGKK